MSVYFYHINFYMHMIREINSFKVNDPTLIYTAIYLLYHILHFSNNTIELLLIELFFLYECGI